MKKFAGLAISIVLVSLLSACSSDPYKNAGKCSQPGESRVENIGLVVCGAIKGDPKWYAEGPVFDELKALGKIEWYSCDDKCYASLVKLSEPRKIKILFNKSLDLGMKDLSAVTKGISRWDGLIEAKSQFDSAQTTEDFLLGERGRLKVEYLTGKATRDEAYKAQEKQIKYLNGEYSAAQEKFDAKLAVLRVELESIYKLASPVGVILFAAQTK